MSLTGRMHRYSKIKCLVCRMLIVRLSLTVVESMALTFFVKECRGVKFYELKVCQLEFGTELHFVRNPSHLINEWADLRT